MADFRDVSSRNYGVGGDLIIFCFHLSSEIFMNYYYYYYYYFCCSLGTLIIKN
jgi:hypothetical protein